MKNFAVFCFIFAVLLATYSCSPIPDEDTLVQSRQVNIRVKRFTCDVLSIEAGSVKLNHAACALHCVYLHKSGGWCDDHRVCNCRA
ncbi:hypothetical protein JTB14_029585 [Gonioctena quinquepunctata]|nr:hypothetical protein JTB14_029585 [Gonioctena quinquepunctata]